MTVSIPCQPQTKPETQQACSESKLIPFYLQQKNKNGKPAKLPEIIAQVIALKPQLKKRKQYGKLAFVTVKSRSEKTPDPEIGNVLNAVGIFVFGAFNR